ncbi:spore cortex-lytic enzyme [Pelotomaculum sp. PtaB.Bin117]|uniref:spore cortex-lytic enzyme n=1 Tax=Pelotomaculum sp. PtaB.Bin117 TaxID=1811694 RepID=UPI00257B119B|nr:spore cortex-lytic enzyme [Pelotomaculum sp. PtaB.Bin117]
MFSKKKLIIYAACLLALAAGLVSLHERQAAAQNPSLYRGSAGDDVFRVQQRLSQWGYYNGSQDGYYGDGTFQAVINFQQNNGIPADGVVGQATWDALGFSVPSETPAVSRGAATDRGDVTLLARVIEGEAADEPLLGKVAVGAVILNRTKSASFPHSISEVIFQPEAFESIENGQAYRPLSEESVQAAQMAMGGYDPSGGALFFWNPGKSVNPWIWSRNIVTQIGNHVFAR